ncbi:hypothetical protein [Oricola sp.]|uniref:hypothetical protein n=1 Tax=Oricola sp. TaxID=1979950 RepID=UPI0025F11259|nr:hypothetical protein [Oricola sp.]MCI5074959.1 hypothetical protein [Oricola sp.]
MSLLHILNAFVLSAAVAIVGGAFDPGAVDTAPTETELAFADAPHGVDPMVTGPVSTSFRERRAIAGCEQAEWPEIPLKCYPDR